ncbi:uncharacterized protein MAM_04380 [Metarhizium album ARSEF 1941]|uniref:BZIP domain-containing protein n=1 Tax=Metarhizium album (strain ARSEF 1941) TaxID=1081103 RepID=A0A0B2WPM1_METAS|nr:uncharacterized protein MAM_04380 [Metarhizium album ARSEF 1941]KHN97991.1 hypothetical protein MAM_04380 [Metarhizium album ARSEF 1941]
MGDRLNSSGVGSRPRTRQRVYKPPPPLEVPDIEDDAAERKRILNVLAQRRYREKKRQKRMRGNSNGSKSTSQEPEDDYSQLVEEVPADGGVAHSSGSIFGADMCFTNWDMMVDPILPSTMPDVTGAYADFLTAAAMAVDDGLKPVGRSDGIPTAAFPSSSVPSSITMSNGMFGSPPSLHSSPNSSSDVSFPDSCLLPCRELTLLRAMLRIADGLGCKGSIWNLDALSPFDQGIAKPPDQLPLPWRPTASQVLILRHRLLDFLPLALCRDRMIGIFPLPDDVRPPAASGPLALVDFAYDFEDNSEGVRIYGSDPYDSGCWEASQVLFQHWWFLFDRDIVDDSNRWRRLRGAPPLALTAPGVDF